MKKYLAFFKIALKKSLEYRGRAFIWLFWDVGSPLIMLFFWLAVFETREQVAGFDYYSMVIYYFVVIFARNLVLTYPDEALQREIYSGEINIYLPRPANLLILKFFYEVAYKFLKTLYLIPLFIFCYFLFLKGNATTFTFQASNVLFFFISCSIAFCFYYLIKLLIGVSAFWFTEVEWIIGFQELVLLFFGGTLFPLDLLPRFMQVLASFLPFKYLFYLPAQGLMGKLNVWQMFSTLIIQIFWLILFSILVKRMYRAGLKRYSAFGG